MKNPLPLTVGEGRKQSWAFPCQPGNNREGTKELFRLKMH